ncbi:MAG: hypothetical protein OEV74_20865 [Cyclobacteriaceae bacterium]|nr:hypothetical protein [Cyclobacteriaceae bacterium]MDH4298737.1 hypothetical protein [Cyclobacteriaceae bacterium]MDH5248518.1 hypothetical protein [Cyclobacteriaceae bacterium]
MKTIKFIRLFAGIMVVIFLLLSIDCSSLNLSGTNKNTHSTIVLKKPGTPVKSDAQLPEKLESEDDYEPQHTFFFIQHVGQSIQLGKVESQRTFFDSVYRFRGILTGIPLYIVIRSMLI